MGCYPHIYNVSRATIYYVVGGAMGLVSRAEMSRDELLFVERVRRIKFNAANGNSARQSASTLRVLKSTPGQMLLYQVILDSSNITSS